MSTRVGVVTFPGSLDDRDALHALDVLDGIEPVSLWHADHDLRQVDAVVLPGGFSYGDYLRCGAIAHRAPIMAGIRDFAADGAPVLGICNGFQILCEARLLPGALLRNEGLRFVSRPARIAVAAASAWTGRGEVGTTLRLPVKHGEGRYHADTRTLARLRDEDRVVFRYAPGENLNGSADDIAGITNQQRNVVGLMPHPEHAVDADLAGGTDGRTLFAAVVAWVQRAPDPAPAPA